MSFLFLLPLPSRFKEALKTQEATEGACREAGEVGSYHPVLVPRRQDEAETWRGEEVHEECCAITSSGKRFPREARIQTDQ